MWPYRLGVRTSGFHPGNRGSNPRRATKKKSDIYISKYFVYIYTNYILFFINCSYSISKHAIVHSKNSIKNAMIELSGTMNIVVIDSILVKITLTLTAYRFLFEKNNAQFDQLILMCATYLIVRKVNFKRIFSIFKRLMNDQKKDLSSPKNSQTFAHKTPITPSLNIISSPDKRNTYLFHPKYETEYEAKLTQLQYTKLKDFYDQQGYNVKTLKFYTTTAEHIHTQPDLGFTFRNGAIKFDYPKNFFSLN